MKRSSTFFLFAGAFLISLGLPFHFALTKEIPLDTSYLRAHAETRGFMLGRPVKARPTPDGKAVLFLRAQARVPRLRLYEFDVATRVTRELLSPEGVLKGAEEHLFSEEKARRERMRVNIGGFTDFQLSEDGSRILVSLSGKLYLVPRFGGEVHELKTGPGPALDPHFSPDAKTIGYVRGNDLCVYDLATRTEHPLTSGGSVSITHGLAEFVAQEEMNRFTGFWWSPDSRSIVYEEADARAVEVWHLADPAHPEQPPQQTFYPRPGKPNVTVRLGIVPIQGGETLWCDWNNEKYPYLAGVHWDKQGFLTFTVQTRDQKEQVLFRADPTSGKTTILLTERDSAWVNIHQDVPRWLEKDQGFLWISESDGGPRLERRGPDGRLAAVLVPSSAGFHSLVDYDPKQGRLTYRVTPDPTSLQLFSLALADLHPVPLSGNTGLHAATFAANHATYVMEEFLPDAMPRSTVHHFGQSSLLELPSVAEDPPVPRAEMVKVGEGPGFFTVVVRPRNFDSRLHYPVVIDVYGGPGHNKVLGAMGTRLLDQWLADQGFLVVSMDGRGTPGRGRTWECALAGHFGSVPVDDQVAALKALGKQFPEMDLDRVGITGWSFGGYLSALAVLRRPDVFKAAVAGAPVVDWLDYDTHYTERYLGLPALEPGAYKEASLLTYAPDLQRPLLLIHGTTDDNVYFRHSLRLVDALFRSGKDFELLPLSGLTHMVPDPEVAEQLWTRTASFFHNHLGKPTP